MPPLTPTDLVLTPKGDRVGAATFGFSHGGTTKYEVLYKRPYDAAWKSLHLANAAAFGTGPYEMEVPLTNGIQYTARAINASGEASTKADAVTSTVDVYGTWFLPFDDGEIVDAAWAFIEGSVSVSQDKDGVLLVPPSREAAINVTTGVVHNGSGEVNGNLREYAGVSGDDWRRRLDALIRNQKGYRWVWLASKREMFKCELLGPITRSGIVMGDDAAYIYSVGFREL